ncbi:uncharacterized protein LOC144658578 isoform X2 [Oculina patagonica]
MISLMANCFTWVKRRREPSKKVTLLMVGLDNAGKTSTVADLTGDSTDGITPTVGFLNSSFSLYRFNVTLFDVGGGARIRSIWKNYYAESFGIVFVVDASDTDRLEECKKALHETVMQPRVAGKPLLILGNKQDNEGALNEDELHRQLELHTLTERYKCPCQVFCCTAVLGKGNKVDRQIKKGFRWLLSEISNDHVNLSRRVEKDMTEQKKAQDEERERKKERVRIAREAREKAEKEAAERAKQQQVEESDDGVVVSKDKKKKKDRDTPEPQTSPRKKKKERETSPEPDVPEKIKKKKKKKKPKHEGDEEIQENTRVEDETPDNLSPVETQENGQQGSGNDLNEGSPINENATSDEVKKKKKKKKRRQNKTAPMEADDYELPPLNAWDTPPGTLNGFPGSSGVSPRRLEPLGPPRLPGSRAFASPSIPERDEEANSLPPIRGTPWTRNRPNSEDCDVVT